MVYLFIVLQVIICLVLIGVILVQQGKSADLAGAFGGQGSQTAFGPRGAANLLTRVTAWTAAAFMITCILLTILMARSSHNRSVLSGVQTGAPATSTPAHPGKK
jgi:preprotein translocase subunit SecG